MAPSTRSSAVRYDHIDLGPEPFSESMDRDSEMEMTIEENDLITSDESEEIKERLLLQMKFDSRKHKGLAHMN